MIRLNKPGDIKSIDYGVLYDIGMSLTIAAYTSEDSIIVATESRSHVKKSSGRIHVINDQIKYHKLNSYIVLLAAGEGISDDFEYFTAYLGRVFGDDKLQNMSLDDIAVLIGSHIAAYWHYPEREAVFDITIAAYRDHPAIYLRQQKTMPKFVSRLDKLSSKEGITLCAGTSKEAQSVFDDYYKLHSNAPVSEAFTIALIKKAFKNAHLAHPDEIGGVVTLMRVNSDGITPIEEYLLGYPLATLRSS